MRVLSGGRDFLFEGAEIAVDIGASEFVVEGGGAERAVDHDIEGGDDAAGLPVIFFPRLDGTGEFKVGDGETAEARLGF